MINKKILFSVLSILIFTLPAFTSALSFSASPGSGAAPLSVRFTATGLDTASTTYTVDFGDSTTGQGTCSGTSGGTCVSGTLYFNHIYQSNGTSTAKLLAATSTSASTTVVSTVQVTVGSGGNTSCIVLSHNMGPGDTDADTGGDVTKLQRFLAQTPSIYPEGTVNGTYGTSTTAAVQRYQYAHNIVSEGDPDTTGYGYTGPQTRISMARGCGTTSTSLTGTPRSGPSPLTVYFTISGATGPRTLDYGDGQSATSQSGTASSHTYTEEGIYTATLSNASSTLGTLTITVGAQAEACIILTRDMRPGSGDAATGGDVSRLQTFLSLDPSIYPEGTISGYFGPATTHAVQRWQSQNGVISSGTPETTGYGAVGKKTRAAMAQGCPSITANPASGQSPLTVNFTAINLNHAASYSIDFGDSSSPPLTVSETNSQESGFSATTTHIYTSPGTSTAKLIKDAETIASTTVHVTAGVPI